MKYYVGNHIDGKVYDLTQENMNAMLAHIKELELEVIEQARLNGMGSEREARLIAELAEVNRKLAETKERLLASEAARARAVEALAFYGREENWYSEGPQGRTNSGVAQETVLWSMAYNALAAQPPNNVMTKLRRVEENLVKVGKHYVSGAYRPEFDTALTLLRALMGD